MKKLYRFRSLFIESPLQGVEEKDLPAGKKEKAVLEEKLRDYYKNKGGSVFIDLSSIIGIKDIYSYDPLTKNIKNVGAKIYVAGYKKGFFVEQKASEVLQILGKAESKPYPTNLERNKK